MGRPGAGAGVQPASCPSLLQFSGAQLSPWGSPWQSQAAAVPGGRCQLGWNTSLYRDAALLALCRAKQNNSWDGRCQSHIEKHTCSVLSQLLTVQQDCQLLCCYLASRHSFTNSSQPAPHPNTTILHIPKSRIYAAQQKKAVRPRSQLSPPASCLEGHMQNGMEDATPALQLTRTSHLLWVQTTSAIPQKSSLTPRKFKL